MTRKTTSLFFVVSFIALVIMSGCGSGSGGSQPGSGSDTMRLVFTDNSVKGTVRLSPSAMKHLLSSPRSSGGDTVFLIMAKSICQPGSSSDTTCWEITASYVK